SSLDCNGTPEIHSHEGGYSLRQREHSEACTGRKSPQGAVPSLPVPLRSPGRIPSHIPPHRIQRGPTRRQERRPGTSDAVSPRVQKAPEREAETPRYG